MAFLRFLPGSQRAALRTGARESTLEEVPSEAEEGEASVPLLLVTPAVLADHSRLVTPPDPPPTEPVVDETPGLFTFSAGLSTAPLTERHTPDGEQNEAGASVQRDTGKASLVEVEPTRRRLTLTAGRMDTSRDELSATAALLSLAGQAAC